MKNRYWLVPCLAALMVCGGKDYYDENALGEKKKTGYAAHFQACFGAIPADYSWDASSSAPYWAATREWFDRIKK